MHNPPKRFGQMGRRQFLGSLAIVPLTSGLTSVALATEVQSAAVQLPAKLAEFAKPGTDIPEIDVNWAMAPFPDETMAVIGMIRGDFKDVGINIGPSSTGAKHDCTETLAALLTGSVDVCSASWESLGAKLDTVQNFRSFVVIGFFTGMAFMKPPESDAKTLKHFLAEGDDFGVALNKTIAQLRGKSVAFAHDPGARLFYRMTLDLAGIPESELDSVDLSNPNIVNAALAEQIDFPAPSGGAEIVRLLNEGFEVLVDQADILENSDDPRVMEIVAHTTYITTDEFYERNYDTVLRAASVIYRILDDLRTRHDEVAPQYQINFLNAYSGQTTTEEDLQSIHENISSLTTFEEAEKFFFGESAVNVYTAGAAQLSALKEAGVLKKSHSPGEMEGSKQVWLDLGRLKEASDALFDQVSGSGQNAEIVSQARMHYDRRNYLDSYRFLASVIET